MRYSCATFRFDFAEPWQEDVFAQALFDAGFDTIDGEQAYIETDRLHANREAIERLIGETEGVELVELTDCPDQNWNEAWEAEHPIEELPMGVQIVPHCAFGAGHHETTAMMIDALLRADLHGKTVLDNGCGTGVLGIMAGKCGAEKVVAVDIDENSVRNTEENAARNGVQIAVSLGSRPTEGQYDLILANIHRNILLEQMALYARYLNAAGQLWLSGFYEDDCAPLIDAAAQEGLSHIATHENGEWRMIEFRKA